MESIKYSQTEDFSSEVKISSDVIATIAAAEGTSPIATRHGTPHSMESIWKPMRNRGILPTKRSVSTPPSRIARNASR